MTMENNLIKSNKFIMVLFLLILITLGFIFVMMTKFVSAQNETINEEANCTEQLTWLISEYNNLTLDYKNGTNCGTIKDLLIDNNFKLSDNLKICNEDLNGYKDYKTGFWMMFIFGIICSLYFIILWNINLRREK